MPNIETSELRPNAIPEFECALIIWSPKKMCLKIMDTTTIKNCHITGEKIMIDRWTCVAKTSKGEKKWNKCEEMRGVISGKLSSPWPQNSWKGFLPLIHLLTGKRLRSWNHNWWKKTKRSTHFSRNTTLV